mmetsp:Transcript_123406/g.213983  ORF Transcript_123406/g.213983 Transcript_123406/m.213983 type:complete len:156 (-) Transcript_123406:411-878(-)
MDVEHNQLFGEDLCIRNCIHHVQPREKQHIHYSMWLGVAFLTIGLVALSSSDLVYTHLWTPYTPFIKPWPANHEVVLQMARGRGKKAPKQRSKSGLDNPEVFTVMDRGQIREAKFCQQCGLKMTWRKKWERNWDEVKYCSERCRRAKKSSGLDES